MWSAEFDGLSRERDRAAASPQPSLEEAEGTDKKNDGAVGGGRVDLRDSSRDERDVGHVGAGVEDDGERGESGGQKAEFDEGLEENRVVAGHPQPPVGDGPRAGEGPEVKHAPVAE